jgi:hypothetical protein
MSHGKGLAVMAEEKKKIKQIEEEKKKIKHGWKPETMGKCAETFMEQISFNFYSFENHDKEIKKLLDQYHQIEKDVAAMPKRREFNPKDLFEAVGQARRDWQTIDDLVKAAHIFAAPALLDELLKIRSNQSKSIEALQEILDDMCGEEE